MCRIRSRARFGRCGDLDGSTAVVARMRGWPGGRPAASDHCVVYRNAAAVTSTDGLDSLYRVVMMGVGALLLKLVCPLGSRSTEMTFSGLDQKVDRQPRPRPHAARGLVHDGSFAARPGLLGREYSVIDVVVNSQSAGTVSSLWNHLDRWAVSTWPRRGRCCCHGRSAWHVGVSIGRIRKSTDHCDQIIAADARVNEAQTVDIESHG